MRKKNQKLVCNAIFTSVLFSLTACKGSMESTKKAAGFTEGTEKVSI